MTLGDNQGDAIEDLVVEVGLGGKTAQAIALRLDLIPMKEAVHNGHVRSAQTTAKPQLIEDQSVGFLGMHRQEARPQRGPDLSVTQNAAPRAHSDTHRRERNEQSKRNHCKPLSLALILSPQSRPNPG